MAHVVLRLDVRSILQEFPAECYKEQVSEKWEKSGSGSPDPQRFLEGRPAYKRSGAGRRLKVVLCSDTNVKGFFGSEEGLPIYKTRGKAEKQLLSL